MAAKTLDESGSNKFISTLLDVFVISDLAARGSVQTKLREHYLDRLSAEMMSEGESGDVAYIHWPARAKGHLTLVPVIILLSLITKCSVTTDHNGSSITWTTITQTSTIPTPESPSFNPPS